MKKKVRYAVSAICASVLGFSAAASHAGDVTGPSETVAFRIDAPSMSAALLQFTEQSRLQLAFASDRPLTLPAPKVVGQLTPRAALDQLLKDTGLKYEFVNDRTVSIRKSESVNQQPEKTSGTSDRSITGVGQSTWTQSRESTQQGTVSTAGTDKNTNSQNLVNAGIPEILVKGSRLLNMDITRSRDDVQPYVIFDRSALESSGASNLNEFFKQRLTMNSVGQIAAQGGSTTGATSGINLRGLGTSQTVILVDGHRIASAFAFNSAPAQPDISSIPLAAIERIDVLPTTASGIYGGGATGGVVNIILRRDYEGAELNVTYGNTFASDAANRRVDFSAGVNFEGGKSNLLFAVSYSEMNPLRVQERDLVQRGRALIVQNNPVFFTGATNPPLGATTNIRSVNGSPLFGPGTASFTTVPAGYAGAGGLAPLQQNAGSYNLVLPDSAQAGGLSQSLLNSPTVKSGTATFRREMTDWLRAFVEVSAAENDGEFFASSIQTANTFVINANAPNNPFGQQIRVTVPSSSADSLYSTAFSDRRGVVGLIANLPRDWRAETDYTWDRFKSVWSAPATLTGVQTTAIANGTLDVLRDTSAFPVDFTPYLNPTMRLLSPQEVTLKDTTLRVAGPFGTFPGGPLTLSMLVEHRTEHIGDAVQFASPALSFYYPSRSQSVDSLYAELKVPFVSARNPRPGIQLLELQIAGRRDKYTVHGATGFTLSPTAPVDRVTDEASSVDPTVGFRYSPVQDVMLRASYGTGFLPPAVNQLIANPPSSVSGASFVDPLRGNQALGPVQLTTGGSADLDPESSESWSVGAVLTPRVLPGLRLSVDYSRIEKTDEIRALSAQQVINIESLFPDRVTREPNLPGDQAGWAGPITGIDQSAMNVATSKVEAYDVALDYRQSGQFGDIDVFAAATWQPHYQTQLLPGTPVIENAGVTNLNPLKLRANAGINWRLGPWRAGWATRYFDSYLVADPTQPSSGPTLLNQGSSSVPSQTYHDLLVGYSFGSPQRPLGSILERMEIQAQITNLFNKQPPFDAGFASGSGQYFYSPFGDPRLRSYMVSLKTTF